MNEIEVLQPIETPKVVVAAKISTLDAQKNAIDAGSTGSAALGVPVASLESALAPALLLAETT